MLAALSVLAYFGLPRHPALIPWYDRHIFYPFQYLRGQVFDVFPFSLGDIIYLVAGVGLLVTLIKWIAWLIQFRQYKDRLALSFVSMINRVLFVYLFFIFGWGANYYQPTLNKYWALNENDSALQQLSKAEFRLKVKNELTAFDTFLVTQLNQYSAHYHAETFKEINERAKAYYATCTDTRLKPHGLGIKPTFYGYFMERLAVEGYYNPFTGEGQENSTLPSFMMPFLVCHEMAHQAGIAAEGDANLMAYAVGTASDDSAFHYSCYLEIWLYTNRRLYYRDSATALRLEKQLNKLTTAHLDTIEQLSRKYDNEYARYSSELFDTYLKMQDQKEGIRSYSNVAASAWQLEQRRMSGKRELITIP